MEIQKIKELKLNIEEAIQQLQLEKAQCLIKEYKSINKYDIDCYIYEGIVNYYLGNLKKAEETLLEAYKKLEYNFDINYNLAMIYESQKKYINSIKFYLRALCLCENELKENINSKIGTLMTICTKYEDKEKVLSYIDFIVDNEKQKFKGITKLFPVIENDNNYLNKFYKDEYFVANYDKYKSLVDGISFQLNNNTRSLIGCEILKCKKKKEFSCNCNEEFILPICSLEENNTMVINDIEVKNKANNRFYYYKLNGKCNVKGEKDIVIAEPIILKKNKKNKDLVLNIFIDGLSQSILDEYGMDNVMPNTYKYFKKGTICTNAYVTAEWTLASVPALFTGKYTTNHKVYNPYYMTELSEDKILTELFKDEGYFTSKIDGNWRTNPAYGYYRGVHRTVYKPSMRQMGVEEIVSEIIDSIETFKDTNEFIWSCVFDLHNVAENIELTISEQVNTELKYRTSFNDHGYKSVQLQYDENKKNKYLSVLKRIDTYLGLLYSYLSNNFKEEDILVSLVSDHGQSYLCKDNKFLLDKERIKVPMMFRGAGVKKGICTELISNVDYMNIIYKLSGGENHIQNTDGVLPKYFGGEFKREYVYTESIFPGQSYKAVITFNDYLCMFETKDTVKNDGRVSMDSYEIKLVKRDSNETIINNNLSEKCLNIVLEHMREFIIY